MYANPTILNLLVEEGLKDNDLITGFNKSHESTEHSYNGIKPLVPHEAHRTIPICQNIPSFAPVVIVTSVSGFKVLPKKGE